MEETTSAVEILDRLVGDDPETRALIAEEQHNLRIARLVYDARTTAGLTQQELASRAGAETAAIFDLEDADYRGNPFPLLARIAAALNRTLEVRLVSPEPPGMGGEADPLPVAA